MQIPKQHEKVNPRRMLFTSVLFAEQTNIKEIITNPVIIQVFQRITGSKFRLFEFEMNNAEKCEKYRKRKKLKEKDREMTLGIYQQKYKELKNKYKELKHNHKLFKLYHGKCQYDQSNEENRHLLEIKENESGEEKE